MAGAIDTKLGGPIVHGRTSACTDHEVKRSNFFFTICIGSMALPAWELHVDSTGIVLVEYCLEETAADRCMLIVPVCVHELSASRCACTVDM